jgi:hypothetical protein
MKYKLTSLLAFALFSICSFAGLVPVTAADKLKTDSLIQIFKSEIHVICKPFRIPDSLIQTIYFSNPPQPVCKDTIIRMKTRDIRYCYKIREGLFAVRNMDSLPTFINLYTRMSDNDSIIYKLKSAGFDYTNNKLRRKLTYKSISIVNDIAESPWVLRCIGKTFKDEVIEWKIYLPL